MLRMVVLTEKMFVCPSTHSLNSVLKVVATLKLIIVVFARQVGLKANES